jgi:hypothetical protein
LKILIREALNLIVRNKILGGAADNPFPILLILIGGYVNKQEYIIIRGDLLKQIGF